MTEQKVRSPEPHYTSHLKLEGGAAAALSRSALLESPADQAQSADCKEKAWFYGKYSLFPLESKTLKESKTLTTIYLC